jgi:hypothetical protein
MAKLKNAEVPRVLPTEYASYRDEVIRALSSTLREAQGSRSHRLVLYDPMAGTAPLLPEAQRSHYYAHFNDLNSLHFYVNAAKTYESYLTSRDIGFHRLLSIVCDLAPGLGRCRRATTERWMEDSVLERLIAAWKKAGEEEPAVVALAKAILLLSVRGFSSFVRTKNPTWLKPNTVHLSKFAVFYSH